MNSHQEDLQHQSRMNTLIIDEEFSLYRNMNARLILDGNQWCCIAGDNLHDGVAAFGDTPYKAVIAFNKEMHKSQITKNT